jgi:SAM-dependent methyltransferase
MIVSLLKKLPIDVGQAEMKHDTAGKRIAFSFLPRVSNSAKALDIGCRDGYWSEKLKAKGYEVKSLDVEPHYPEALAHDIETGLPYKDNSFDVLWCTEVIEHLYRPEELFKEVERVLKSGGRAVFTTPNSAWWFYKVVGLWGWTPKKLQNPDHKQFFNEEGIRKSAPNYDLYGYFPYLNFFFFKIKRLVGFLSPTFVLLRKN